MALAATALVLTVSSCSAAGSATGSSSNGDGTSEVAAAKKALEPFQTVPKTLTGNYAGGTPVTAPKNKTLGVLPLGLAGAPDQERAVAALQSAGEKLGWKVIVQDGKFSPQGWASGMERLVQQKPDAIISIAVPDSAIPQALKTAHDAGIYVACVFCANSGFAPVDYPSAGNAGVDPTEQGIAVGNYVIANSGAKAKIAVQHYSPSQAAQTREKAANTAIANGCSGCDVISEKQLMGTDLGQVASQVTQSTLAQHPVGQLDYVLSASDVFNPSVFQAIRASNRTDTKVVSYDCDSTGISSIRAGGPEVACADTNLAFGAYAALNLVIHHMVGQDMKTEKVPFTLVTKDNVPATGDEGPHYDYVPYFEKLWNVG